MRRSASLVRKALPFLKSQGLWATLCCGIAAALRRLTAHRFRCCGFVFLRGAARFSGARYISIGDIVGGSDLKVEAIDAWGGQRFQPRLVIGRNFRCTDHVRIGCTHRVWIGDNVLFGSYIYVTDHDHGVYSGGAPHSPPGEVPADRPLTDRGRVIIHDNVHVGSFVTVTKNVIIGYGSVVAANSVVTKDIPPLSIVAGAPARVVKRFNVASRMWERVNPASS